MDSVAESLYHDISQDESIFSSKVMKLPNNRYNCLDFERPLIIYVLVITPLNFHFFQECYILVFSDLNESFTKLA